MDTQVHNAASTWHDPKILLHVWRAVSVRRLLLATLWVLVGGVAAMVAMAAATVGPTMSEPLTIAILLQVAGALWMGMLRTRPVALAGLGLACAAPLAFPVAAPPALVLIACLWPLAAQGMLFDASFRVAALAGLGWVLPAMHATFGYSGIGYHAPLLATAPILVVALWRSERGVWPWSGLYVAIVLFLGYA